MRAWIRQDEAATGAARRRAVVLIFALGVLTLLALIGVGLMASMQGEHGRVRRLRSTLAEPALLDGVVRSVQERLRADLWDGTGFLDGDANTAPTDSREDNEPFDAPGPFDRWLGSTLPYLERDGLGIALNVPTGNAANPTEQVLVWPRVSYVGADIANETGKTAGPNDSLFYWTANSRAGLNVPYGPGVGPLYGDTPGGGVGPRSLTDVRVMMTPPDYNLVVNPLITPDFVRTTFIAGSTTDVTIAEARRIWSFTPQGVAGSKFPYFDTNMDGALDLYDADGDGVPDSPLSFVMPYPRRRPEDPREVYVAVRVVDNASMLNVNTALARDTNGDGTFDGGDLFGATSAGPDFQYRGRRVSEVSMDVPLLAAGDMAAVFDGDRAANLPALLAQRFGGQGYLPAGAGGASFYGDVVVRQLVGGWPRTGLASPYTVFGPVEEAALRNRFSLIPYRSVGELEALLPATFFGGTQWERYNNPADWLTVLDSENATGLLRRTLFTTDSAASQRMPTLPSVTLTGLGAYVLDRGGVQTPIPFLAVTDLTEKVDLNPIFRDAGGNPRQPTDAELAEYIARLALAVYAAGDTSLRPIDPLYSGAPSREELAWQFAANVVDYIDQDDEPTVIVDPSISTGQPIDSVKYVGLEAQPFLSKYGTRYSKDAAGNEINSETRHAIELVNPYDRVMGNVPGDYRVRVFTGASVDECDLDPIPVGTGGAPGRRVLQDRTGGVISDAVVPPTVNGVLDFGAGDHIVLTRKLIVGASTVYWPIDHIELPASFNPKPTGSNETQITIVKRDETDWRFAASFQVTTTQDTVPLGTDIDLRGTAPTASPPPGASHWVFRNGGLVQRNFESVGEISRLLAVGTRPPPTPSATYQFKTATRYLADAQRCRDDLRCPQSSIVAGRFDFTDRVRSGGLTAVLVCTSIGHDGFDNDGDGFIDEPTEGRDVGWRVAGQINVNTAPTMVLRCVPWMIGDPDDVPFTGDEWDFASAIVAYREDRAVGSPWAPGIAPQPGSTERLYRSPTDVFQASSGNSAFSMQRFANDAFLLPDNDADPRSPNYDAALDDATAIDDIREHDIFLARWANILTTRSDVFTVYAALIDENGNYLRRTQFTLDRGVCVPDTPAGRRPVLPAVIARQESGYADDAQ